MRITASSHAPNTTPDRSYTYNALHFGHSIHITGIMQCHKTKKFSQNTNEITMYMVFQLIHPIHKNFFVSCFYGLTCTMVPQWENKCHNKTHSTKQSSCSKGTFIHFTRLDKFWLERRWNLTDYFTCYIEHPALGKLCIRISHWHTSNGNWFFKKYDLVTIQWSSISLSDDGKASAKFQTDIMHKDRPTTGHTFLTRGFKSE